MTRIMINLITMFFILLLFSCNKNTNFQKSKVENSVIEKSISENKNNHPIPTSSNELNSKPALINFFKEQSYFDNLIYINATTQNEINLFKFTNTYEPIFIKVLPKNTEIIILAETQKELLNDKSEDYYLIKVVDEKELWAGWVQKKEVNVNILKSYPNFILFTGLINISENNEYLTFSTGWEGEICVITRLGSTIITLPFKRIQEEFSDEAVDGYFLGWSEDQKTVWFVSSVEGWVICYIKIDIISGKYQLLPRPKNFNEQQIRIDYNNGDVLYTDEKTTIPYDEKETLAKTNNKIHLYYSNLYNDQEFLVDTSEGTTFVIKNDNNGNLIYRKNNENEFKRLP